MPKRNAIAFGAGLVLIGLGFYTLAKGSLTLAPVLLLTGYFVAIPMGIMMRSGREEIRPAAAREQAGE